MSKAITTTAACSAFGDAFGVPLHQAGHEVFLRIRLPGRARGGQQLPDGPLPHLTSFLFECNAAAFCKR